MKQKKTEESICPSTVLPSIYFKHYNVPNYYIHLWNRIWAIAFVIGFIVMFAL